MANRLAQSTSPYLLQHADNPVEWWPWCPEAFAEAERRGVPVLLSVGYAACHWCHVMAHESFEDAETAAQMNAEFVNIKVDREERPDVDAVYMDATVAMTGQGGWPMTVFCTPAGKPFFCGTYFPPRQGAGMPSFRQVLTSVGAAWRQRRAEIEDVGEEVVRRLSERAAAGDGAPQDRQPPGPDELHEAFMQLVRDFDSERGGFGGAPKFPPSMILEFLLRHHARTGAAAALEMIGQTCEAMARGGMYDQLGGGFARYSVDDRWVVPHFEKMLYDNALLLRGYTHWWRATGSAFARRVALETAAWMLRDLRTPEGGFASALDADSEGVEGRYYVWTPEQLRGELGEAAADAARWFDVTDEGTFEHGASVLRRLAEPDDPQEYETARARLLEARSRRVPPARDDKVVAAWNGLAIAGLAEAGALFDRPELVGAAAAAADLLAAVHLSTGSLLRTSRGGRAGVNAGVLEDYADVAEGLLALYAVTGERRRLDLAGELLEAVLTRFADGRGGYYDTAEDAERLVRRPQEPTDNATPSGQAAAAGALLTYAAYTGSARHREAAAGVLGALGGLVTRHPRFGGWALAVAEAYVDGPREVAVVGAADDAGTRALRRAALLGTAPGAVLAVGVPAPVAAASGATGLPALADAGDPGGEAGVPLLRGRPLVDGRPAAYVCRHFVCEAPTTDPAALADALGVRVPL